MFCILSTVDGSLEALRWWYLLLIHLLIRRCIGTNRVWTRCIGASTPSIQDWYDIIYEIVVMERITFCPRLQEIKFERKCIFPQNALLLFKFFFFFLFLNFFLSQMKNTLRSIFVFYNCAVKSWKDGSLCKGISIKLTVWTVAIMWF